ncbi:MAG TPA: lactate utilization protein, partial [Fimbriimonadaceae bacterium]|nr:lactate utilization protein [Fimbriimonadaceae bacterium]
DRENGVVLSRNPLLGRLGLASVLGDLGIPFWTWDPSSPDGAHSPAYRDRCFSAAAGITGVDFALAESGSLVVSSATEGAQLSSLAPPVHIAFYLRSQIVETLEEVLQGLKPSAGGSALDGRSIVLITGTSRTADIEQILIRGVHGPREVHAILVEDSYFTVAE